MGSGRGAKIPAKANEIKALPFFFVLFFVRNPVHQKPMEPQAPAPRNTLGAGTYAAKHIIVATGARRACCPGIEPDGKLIWTYFEAMVPPEMPRSLIVMGSGAIGIEFASFYRTMGRR